MKNEAKPISEELKRMAAVDVRTVNPEELVDVESVKINQELPVEARIRDYVRQIKNPYCYISHGTIVKIGFSGTRTLEECLAACVSMEA